MPMSDEQRRLVEDNIKLAWYQTSKWFERGVSFKYEELFSIFSLALCKASYGFNPEKGIKFSTFATKCMENELKMEFRKMTQVKRVNEVALIALSENGEVLETDNNTLDENSLLEFERFVNIVYLKEAFAQLDEREKLILYLRFYAGERQESIAKNYGLNISRSYVSRIERKALIKLRKWNDKLEFELTEIRTTI